MVVLKGGNNNNEDPIPFDIEDEETRSTPLTFAENSDVTSKANVVSHSPLNLGHRNCAGENR